MALFENGATREVLDYEPDIDKYIEVRNQLTELLAEAGNGPVDPATQAKIEQLQKEVTDRALSANEVIARLSQEQ